MKEMQDERDWAAREILGRLGIQARIRRLFQSESDAINAENFIRSLPMDNRFQTPLQDPDGRIIHMYGVTGYGTSPYGGGS